MNNAVLAWFVSIKEQHFSRDGKWKTGDREKNLSNRARALHIYYLALKFVWSENKEDAIPSYSARLFQLAHSKHLFGQIR